MKSTKESAGKLVEVENKLAVAVAENAEQATKITQLETRLKELNEENMFAFKRAIAAETERTKLIKQRRISTWLQVLTIAMMVGAFILLWK